MTSPDSITWTARNAASLNNWVSVIYGNGIFAAVARNTNKVMTSPDGINWTNQTISLQSVNGNNFIIYGAGYFIAAGSGTSSVFAPAFTYSYNYNVNTANSGTYIDGIATVSLSSVNDLAGNTSSNPTNNTFTIDTVVPTVALSYSASPAGVGVETITATYSKPLAAGPTISINQPGSLDVTNASMSAPGSVWIARPAPDYNYSWRNITYCNGIFVSISFNRVITSPDGIN